MWQTLSAPATEGRRCARTNMPTASRVKAAKEKNLEAATLAYVRVTMSCVNCHKLVRGKLVASADGLSPTTLAAHPRLD